MPWDYFWLSTDKSWQQQCFVLFVCFLRHFFHHSTKDYVLCTYWVEQAVWAVVFQQVVLFYSTKGNLKICLNLEAVLSFLQLLTSSVLAPPVRCLSKPLDFF